MPSLRPVLGHSLRLIWTLFAALIVAFCVMMQRAWHPTGISVGLTVLAGLLVVFGAYGVIGTAAGSARARDRLPLAMGLGSLVALAPGCVRAAMPWEDPSDFSGSPMAVLVGIGVMTVFFVIVVGVPMLAMAIAARRDGGPPGTTGSGPA